MTNHNMSFAEDSSGNIAIASALFLSIAALLAALVIDIGMLFHERRKAQGAVDMAAIAAASDLGSASAAANATLAANGYSNGVIATTTLGQYSPDQKIPPAQRFVENIQAYNAAKVTLAKQVQTLLVAGWWRKPIQIDVAGIATTTTEASFSLGSRLASVNGGLLNSLLGSLVGGNVSLSAMDYNALASGNVTLGSFLKAMATRLNIQAGTYNDVLNANASFGDVLAALVSVTQATNQTSAASALSQVAAAGHTTSLAVPLSQLIELGPVGSVAIGQNAPGLDSKLSLLGLVNGAGAIANGGQQVTLNLGATVPGIASLKVDLAIGQPLQHSGWVAVGQDGATLSTSQLRLRITAQIAGSGLLAGSTVRLPVVIDAAHATARLSELSCNASGDTATIGATPGIVSAWIGDTAQLAIWPSSLSVAPAQIVSTPLLTISGYGSAAIADTSERMLTFTAADAANGTIKTATTSNYLSSVVSTVLGKTSLTVRVLGLGLATPEALQTALAQQLQTVAAPLDQVVYNLLEALGVHLGQADVRVYGINCRGAVLGG